MFRWSDLFTQNLGAKAISVLMAVMLWVAVLGSRKTEVIKEVPLEIVTPPELSVTNDLPATIAFRLGGPKAFLRNVLSQDHVIRVNLSDAKPGLITYRFFSDNLDLPIGIKVLAINPSSVLIKLEKTRTRTVPVKVELSGEPPAGYQVVKTEVIPEKVKIKGARSRVNSVSEIYTRPVDVANLKGIYEGPGNLDLSGYGVDLVGDVPQVRVEVKPVSPNFRIRNVAVRVKATGRYRVRPQAVTVFVRAAPEDLKTLDPKSLFAEVDVRGRAKGTYKEKITVTAPPGVGVVEVSPPEANVEVF